MTEFVLSDETHCVRAMLADLTAISKKLRPWERDFIDSLTRWTGNFTQRQSETAVRMHYKYFKESK